MTICHVVLMDCKCIGVSYRIKSVFCTYGEPTVSLW